MFSFEDIKLNNLDDDSLSENTFTDNKKESSSTISKRLNFEDDSPCSTSVSDVSKNPFANLLLKKGRKHQSDNQIINQSSKSELFGTKSCLVNPVLSRVISTDSMTKSKSSNGLEGILKAITNSKNIQMSENLLKELNINRNQDEESTNEPFDLLAQTPKEKLKDLGNSKKIECIEEDDQDLWNEDFELDFSRRLSLSASKSMKLPDFNIISPQSTADLFYKNSVSDFLIVDCRYNYEYQGGHIKGALNITSPELLEKVFFTHKSLLYNPKYIQDLKGEMHETLKNVENYKLDSKDSLKSKLPMIIFHCEFSQQRGPRAYSTVRNQDRDLNIKRYPYLDYPDIFVLEGGYRNFYSQFREHCDGGLVKMRDKNYKNEFSQAQESEKITWYKKQFGKSNS